jgi:hypothetical protein
LRSSGTGSEWYVQRSPLERRHDDRRTPKRVSQEAGQRSRVCGACDPNDVRSPGGGSAGAVDEP